MYPFVGHRFTQPINTDNDNISCWCEEVIYSVWFYDVNNIFVLYYSVRKIFVHMLVKKQMFYL